MTTQQPEALQCAADIEAQLEAIGAGGVSGPLIGQPQAMPDLSQLTERGAKAWAGVDAQGRPEGFTAADMATAAAQGFRDGATAPAQPVAAPATRQGGAYAALPVPNYPKSGGFPGTFAEAQMRAFADATHTLRAPHGQAPAQPDPAYSAACHLATALFKKYFAHLPDFASGQAVWGLCGSTAGVISQIDNMVSCLLQPPTTAFSEDELE